MISKKAKHLSLLGFTIALVMLLVIWINVRRLVNKKGNSNVKENPKDILSLEIGRGVVLSKEETKLFIKEKLTTTWHFRTDKLESLSENPLYYDFQIKRSDNRPSVDLLLIVSSAPFRSDRRTAIRETWWSQCKSNQRVSVKCIFMTDHQNESTPLGQELMNEKSKYNDVEFQNLAGGVTFGIRYLYHLVWAMQNYKFNYVMRMDDDYFLCMERFLMELPLPMKPYYHWGWTHCIPNIVRPEESIILFSKDIVEKFLLQDPEKIYCHPWADQMVGLWVENLKLSKLYRHDKRLHHHPPAAHLPKMKTENNICQNYIGIHGSYPAEQRVFWNNRGNSSHVASNLDNHSWICEAAPILKWQLFYNTFKYEPKLCIENPFWDTSKQMGKNKFYGGRQMNLG